MSVPRWGDDHSLPDQTVPLWGWPLIVVRVAILVPFYVIGVALALVMRGVESLIWTARRPLSGAVVRFWSALTLLILGFRLRKTGRPMAGGGAMVANHSSWLDILVLNAPVRVHFMAKAEVEGWAVIGFIAKVAGTVFIKRDRREAAGQVEMFRDRLALGQKLLFFPEGTSTDGRRVIPFKPTLFAAFFAPDLKDQMQVQPISVVYTAPKGREARFYGWYGSMDMAPSFLAVLGSWRQGKVELVYHAPVRVADFADRKLLAAHCEAAVRGPILAAL